MKKYSVQLLKRCTKKTLINIVLKLQKKGDCDG